jgi:hypothetical protein
MFAGEWPFDTREGVPYFTEVMVKNPNISHVEAVFKKAIIETDDVNKIIRFSMTFDALHRALAISFTVDTTYGELTLDDINLRGLLP